MNTINWNFFERRLLLNCPGANERLGFALQECSRVGLTVERFEAVKAETPILSFNKSFFRMIYESFCKIEPAKSLLVVEDDIEFRGDLQHVNAALQELPADWDVLYFGANLQQPGMHPPVKYSPHLCRVYNAWTTHCIAFHGSLLPRIIATYPGDTVMFDAWLSENILPRYKAFCITPMVAWQKPGPSQIWFNGDQPVHADYTTAFVRSNLRLQKAMR